MSCGCECEKGAEAKEFVEEVSAFTTCEACETEAGCKDDKSCSKGSYKATECPPGEELVEGECRKVAVTLEVDIDEIEAVVEASTGNTIIEIRGVAFHEGVNKNGWSLTSAGAKSLIHQMEGADVTLNHPEASEHGSGFTRNMDGGVEEAVVGYIKSASFFTTQDGYEVRYVAHVVRHELFDSLESGLWSRDDYGVSIGGSGIPIESDEEGIVFGEDFTFDHLAIVHRPAYERASIENVRRIEKPEEIQATFISHSKGEEDNQEVVSAMTEQEIVDNTNLEAEIESLKADLVLASSRVAEFEAAEDARVEEERVALVEQASEMGMSGHDDLQADTIRSLIASWEASHPEPAPVVMEEVTSEPSVEETPVAASETPKSVVANYLNGKMVESDEGIYERAYNAWARAWNGTLDRDEDGLRAKSYSEIKEMI